MSSSLYFSNCERAVGRFACENALKQLQESESPRRRRAFAISNLRVELLTRRLNTATRMSSLSSSTMSVTTPDAASANTSASMFWVQVLALTGYSIMSGLCILLICYLRLNRHVAFRGDERAARKLILPAYEPLMFLLALETAGFAIYTAIALSIKRYTTHLPAFDSEVYYAGRQFVFVTVIVFILQKSVSMPALRRTIVFSMLLSSYTLPIVFVLSYYYEPTSNTAYWITVTCRRLLLILYGYVFCKPPSRASVRSLRAYCLYVALYHAIIMTSSTVSHYNVASTASDVFSCTVIVWGSLCPLWIWHVLRSDTEYWRGMGQRACTLQASYRQRRAINEHLSSHGLHVLIEMHRKYIIDFAHLEVKSRIGVGASAVVFSGVLKSQRPVAIKTYTPRNFNEETVAQFSHEAAFCATLHHPNIVEFIGMCVSPPTISLVAELCKASLEDLLFAQAHRPPATQRLHSHEKADAQALLRTAYMLDAARAVAYLHSFSPPLLHRDLKPANFLVDVDNNIKLADFGESRQLPRQQVPAHYFTEAQQEQLYHSISDCTSGTSHLPTVSAPAPATPVAMMTVTGTVHYMPPEMIRGRSGLAAYGQAADVYSLAVTLWDILYPQRNKYVEVRDNSNHFQVLERVLAGGRPEFDVDVHPKLRDLIVWGWHPDPNCRPSAQQLVAGLESLQEETLASLAVELSDDFDRAIAASGVDDDQHVSISLHSLEVLSNASSSVPSHPQAKMEPADHCFTGEFMVERMEAMFDVDPQSGEGIRLGHALMDAGFLHHASHSQNFECSGAFSYFFDSDAIQFNQPVAMLEEKCAFDGLESGSETLFSPSVANDDDGRMITTLQYQCEVSDRIGLSQPKTPQPQTNRSRSGLMSRIASTFSSVTSSAGPRRNAGKGCYEYYMGKCACRRLGQRLEIPRKSPDAQRARHERVHRFGVSSQAISEEDEDMLMRKLLAEDHHASRDGSDVYDHAVTPAA